MKTTFAFAVCAALSLAVTACGDDDDDAASDDSSALSAPESDDTSPSPADTATTGTTDDGDGADATSGDSGAATGDTAAAIEVSDEQAADCVAFEELNDSMPDVDAPDIGEEITDEYRDDARSAIELLEDLDLQSDEAQAARESLVDDINEVIDADTMTEELQALGASEELVEFGEICAASAGG